MKILAKNAGALLGTLVVTLSASLAGAQDFPSENMTMVIGWPAGGAQDTVGRLVAEHLGQQLSTTVVVSNVPGAAGANGVREVETAEPDGYTIGTIGLHGVAQAYINENATAMDAIEPLALVNIDPAALTVSSSMDISSLEEFIAFAKENPGVVINGNDSPGGFSFLNAQFIERNLEIEMTKVPYQGFAPTVAALVAGEVETVTLPVPLLADLHEAGDVKILGVAAAERHFAAPDVPTFQEQGIDYVFSDYVVIFGPKGLPEDVKGTLEAALLAAMDTDGFKASAETIGLILDPQGADAARETIANVDAEVYPVMLDAGLVTTRQR
ncbi:Bug family tripartite tricarboxylate transporter substrate binding protein [Aliihoeflea sp. PC F10.4]